MQCSVNSLLATKILFDLLIIICSKKHHEQKMEVRNTSSKYTSTLIAFMSFIDGVKYNATSSFSRDKLLAITADQVAAYLNYKAYGTPTPGPTDRPTQG